LLGFRRRNRALCPARVEIKKLCRHRASKRWSALLTQTKSRIGHKCGMRKRLGEANWAAFVRYATAQFKESFIRSLMPTSGVLCCEGTIHGAACPNHVHVDLMRTDTAQCAQQLPKLHMDHTHDVAHICDVWSQALPEEPRSWDDGVCGPLVAHLLFGTEDHVLSQCSVRPVWRKQIVFRCGNVKGVAGQHAGQFCHDVANAHYGHTLHVRDIQWPTVSPTASVVVEETTDDETDDDATIGEGLSDWSATDMSSQESA